MQLSCRNQPSEALPGLIWIDANYNVAKWGWRWLTCWWLMLKVLKLVLT